MEQSIGLASEVQKSFTSAKRVDRGVRQAGFLVLRKTSMPSVLVELGYISTKSEERFLASSAGQKKLASAIYNAFTKYKWEYDRKRGALGQMSSHPAFVTVDNEPDTSGKSEIKAIDTDSPAPGSEEDIRRRHLVASQSKRAATASNSSKTTSTSVVRQVPSKGQRVFKVQILSSGKKLSTNSKLLKGYKDVDFFVEKGVYKYTYGETTSFDEAKKIRRRLLKDFKDAFIVAFKDGKRVTY